MKDKKQNENRFWYLFLLIPVIWLALKTAPCFGGTFPEFVIEFGNAMMKPFNIVWCDASPVCIAVFTGVFLLAMGIYTSTRPNLRKGEEHGSARWAAIDEINSVVAQDEYIPLTKHIRLGMNSREHRKNLNILVIGGSGSGKTRNFAIPGILQETGSFVITDPKAEILSTVGYALKNAGYTIHVLNLIDMEHSDPYNPFAYIRSDSDVLKLITNLIKNTTPRNAAHQDPFWEKAETALLEALVFALRDYGSDEEKNFGTVMEMLTYADVREDDSSYRSPLDMFFDHIESSYPGNIASKQYSIYKQGAGQLA